MSKAKTSSASATLDYLHIASSRGIALSSFSERHNRCNWVGMKQINLSIHNDTEFLIVPCLVPLYFPATLLFTDSACAQHNGSSLKIVNNFRGINFSYICAAHSHATVIFPFCMEKTQHFSLHNLWCVIPRQLHLWTEQYWHIVSAFKCIDQMQQLEMQYACFSCTCKKPHKKSQWHLQQYYNQPSNWWPPLCYCGKSKHMAADRVRFATISY